MLCPCCGSKINQPSLLLESLPEIPITPGQREIMGYLLEAYPKAVSTDTLIEGIYGDDPNGGPLTVNALAVQICRMRSAINPYGWTIPLSREGPGRVGQYRLVKIEERSQ